VESQLTNPYYPEKELLKNQEFLLLKKNKNSDINSPVTYFVTQQSH
jgi:hypothetical protein